MKNVNEIKSTKGKEKLVALTCYDHSFAKAMDSLVDIILVGDSVANVVYGYETTRKVGMAEMLLHTAAVASGALSTFIVGDMPFGSDANASDAAANAGKFLEAGADAVKIEGKPEIVKALVGQGIDVMGHVGLLPQTAEKMRLYGKEEQEAQEIIDEALAIEKAGAFCLVIEAVPEALGKKISEMLAIPTIGIGAGKFCDGQILVSYDLLGLYDKTPRFVKKYAHLREEIQKAVSQFREEVKNGKFP